MYTGSRIDGIFTAQNKMAFPANVKKKIDGTWMGGLPLMCHLSVPAPIWIAESLRSIQRNRTSAILVFKKTHWAAAASFSHLSTGFGGNVFTWTASCLTTGLFQHAGEVKTCWVSFSTKMAQHATLYTRLYIYIYVYIYVYIYAI